MTDANVTNINHAMREQEAFDVAEQHANTIPMMLTIAASSDRDREQVFHFMLDSIIDYSEGQSVPTGIVNLVTALANVAACAVATSPGVGDDWDDKMAEVGNHVDGLADEWWQMWHDTA